MGAHSQQTMNPPPYVRNGSQQGGYAMSNPASSNPYGAPGGHMMMNQNPMQQNPQPQRMIHSQLRGTWSNLDSFCRFPACVEVSFLLLFFFGSP